MNFSAGGQDFRRASLQIANPPGHVVLAGHKGSQMLVRARGTDSCEERKPKTALNRSDHRGLTFLNDYQHPRLSAPELMDSNRPRMATHMGFGQPRRDSPLRRDHSRDGARSWASFLVGSLLL